MRRRRVGVEGKRGSVKPNDTVVEDLAKQIKDLSPPDRLRLAAALLESGKAQLAYTILRQVKDELGAALALL